MDVGKHPFVARLLLKGTFIQDRHFFLIFKTLGSSCGTKYYSAVRWYLSLKQLTLKLVMLMSLIRPFWSADLVSLNLDHCQYKPEGVVSYSFHYLKKNHVRWLEHWFCVSQVSFLWTFFSLPTTVHVKIDLIPPLDESPCNVVQYNSFLQKRYPKRQDTRVIWNCSCCAALYNSLALL